MKKSQLDIVAEILLGVKCPLDDIVEYWRTHESAPRSRPEEPASETSSKPANETQKDVA